MCIRDSLRGSGQVEVAHDGDPPEPTDPQVHQADDRLQDQQPSGNLENLLHGRQLISRRVSHHDPMTSGISTHTVDAVARCAQAWPLMCPSPTGPDARTRSSQVA